MGDSMRRKNQIMLMLLIMVAIMAIGYAVFSTTLNISGTSSIESNWNVLFTNIQELSKTNGVTINNTPTASGTTATFDVSLESPGDAIEYQITIANQGTLDAVIENIETTETENSALLFEVSGINKVDKLAKNTTTTFNIKISYDESISSQPEELNKTLTINITYVQDIGQVIEPGVPVNTYDLTYVSSSYDNMASALSFIINGNTYNFGQNISNIKEGTEIKFLCDASTCSSSSVLIKIGDQQFEVSSDLSHNKSYIMNSNVTYEILGEQHSGGSI